MKEVEYKREFRNRYFKGRRELLFVNKQGMLGWELFAIHEPDSCKTEDAKKVYHFRRKLQNNKHK